MGSVLHDADMRGVFETSGIDLKKYIVAHYRVVPQRGMSVEEAAAVIALNTSLGTLSALSYESPGARHAAVAKVLSATQRGDAGDVRIAFPMILCDPGRGLARLLGVLWYAAEYSHTGHLWLEDIEVPREAVPTTLGPKTGISSLRQNLGIHGRAIIGVIAKPRLGASLSVIVKYIEECLSEGADYVIDDELITDPPGELAFAARVGRFVKAAERSAERTKSAKWYIANVTAGPSRAREYARVAREMGAHAVLVNAFTMGFSAIEELVHDVDYQLPVISSNMGSAMVSRSESETGTSEVVISRLSRLAGADGVYCGIRGASWYSAEVLRASINALRSESGLLKPTMPVVAGGLTVANIWTNYSLYGKDVMLQAGTGLLGYPAGPGAGARAFRRIVEEVEPDLPPEEAARRLQDLGERSKDIADGLRRYGWVGRLET